jgi:hypothetical protein
VNTGKRHPRAANVGVIILMNEIADQIQRNVASAGRPELPTSETGSCKVVSISR